MQLIDVITLIFLTNISVACSLLPHSKLKSKAELKHSKLKEKITFLSNDKLFFRSALVSSSLLQFSFLCPARVLFFSSLLNKAHCSQDMHNNCEQQERLWPAVTHNKAGAQLTKSTQVSQVFKLGGYIGYLQLRSLKFQYQI